MRIDCDEVLDERLAERMRDGDALAFAALATRYWHLVLRVCWSLLPSAREARETTEDIFLQAARGPESAPPVAPYRTWLLKLALRKALARRPSMPAETWMTSFLPRFDGDRRLNPAGSDGWVLDEVAFNGRATREWVREALRHLDGLDHAAFVLRVTEELPVDETAAILGIPAEGVRRRTHRASLMLTGYVGELFEAPRMRAREAGLRPQDPL